MWWLLYWASCSHYGLGSSWWRKATCDIIVAAVTCIEEGFLIIWWFLHLRGYICSLAKGSTAILIFRIEYISVSGFALILSDALRPTTHLIILISFHWWIAHWVTILWQIPSLIFINWIFCIFDNAYMPVFSDKILLTLKSIIEFIRILLALAGTGYIALGIIIRSRWRATRNLLFERTWANLLLVHIYINIKR